MRVLPLPLKSSACSQTLSLSGFVELWNTLLLKLFWDNPRRGSLTFPCCLSLFPSEAPVRDVILHQTSGRIHNKNVSTHLIGSIARGERSAAWGLQPSSCPWWFFSTEWNQISCGRKKTVRGCCKDTGISASLSQLPKKDSWIFVCELFIAFVLP